MKKKNKIHHMGMKMAKDEHDRFHAEGQDLAPERHDTLMKKLGITREEDEEWHRTHLTLGQQRALQKQGLRPVNPFQIGGAFLEWCVGQGWLEQHTQQYFATQEGARELHSRFGIRL